MSRRRDGPAAMFAAEFPDQWRRSALVPGLRERVVDHLRASGGDDAQRRALGYLLGYGRTLTDQQWCAWAAAAFRLTIDPP